MTKTADLHLELIQYLEEFPANVQATAEALANTFKKTCYTSHINFIGSCIQKNLIPCGFQLKIQSRW